jgi:hypothetical protein
MAARTVEILSCKRPSVAGAALLAAMGKAIAACGDLPVARTVYAGRSDWLLLFGVGHPQHDNARAHQVLRGGHAALWDLGYFRKGDKAERALRVSVDQDHPQRLLDRAPPDASRWLKHATPLREDADPAGPILLIGLGVKSRAYLNAPEWERQKLAELQQRFPGRRIVHRPKPGRDYPRLNCERDEATPIDALLKGASRVVARHSNVAVDAAIAGVPIEVEDGAAQWLAEREYTPANRLEFLQRLAWFQWGPSEAKQAWQFIRELE